ncbi:hypothetical protein CFBP498_26220 [Xanthomonas hortorum pv. vitians]|uniref:Uncharacterized protein n=1 Tax=Xanthomonas hortorum pv. vitians TaxID=83224 RepID=A0A6V7DQP1_9XANT|nr:hypothetical protein [Xanthomonas hortorum]MCE4302381.1 hypothetical protein [Xanthomonas hortorum pv. vitians]MDT7826212.1 hypothetical protein [Xanthomonas hortorum pv. vitians]MDV7248627.1 hypothetical protein [Xanthomonas hortorum pv. vitians]NMI32479.1 hypothetical protein [Xanthomonas hortorum pv. vitians]CAD0338836.1 hypothetical protein CFBP498_26220 [Xanthomonas hortorum pv. vitians]
MRKCNLPIAVIAACWWWLETNFFGWNQTPGSTAELFADSLALVLFAAAFAFPQRPAVRIEVRHGHTIVGHPGNAETADG